ncbi:TPA: tail fiber assembly protein [Enterobacter asburiae]|uniref:tail fiber assembly protein n=1 Tax=Enterobacter asburiae TaxID=61645 RepID=UPI0028E7E12C|nr:tail fiber assembly protein [Enterobacter asburiae]WNS32131.1 tail fiber assembly protein [Enterobacter asburiae]
MKIYYSPSLNGFLLEKTAEDYKGHDLIEITEAVYNEFMAGSTTKKMVPGANGPEWADIPPPTHDELVAAAGAEKQQRIDLANEFMNSKQWPGKAAIGRLKGDELTQYNLWLDYLDALEAVDTSSAPAIEWPTPPGE